MSKRPVAAKLHLIMRAYPEGAHEDFEDFYFVVPLTLGYVEELLQYAVERRRLGRRFPALMELRVADETAKYYLNLPDLEHAKYAFDEEEDAQMVFDDNDLVVVSGLRETDCTIPVEDYERMRVVSYSVDDEIGWSVTVTGHDTYSVESPNLDTHTLGQIHAQLLMMEET